MSGDEFKNLRQGLSLSLDEMARLAGVDVSTVILWERAEDLGDFSIVVERALRSLRYELSLPPGSLTVEQLDEMVHAICGGRLVDMSANSDSPKWVCDTCGECWDDLDLFERMKRRDWLWKRR
jgi:transcriptional regulator with XRE-family HTH domain